MSRLITFMKQIFAPAHCVQCTVYLDNQDHYFCVTCSDSIQPVSTIEVPITEKYKATLHSVSDYKDPVKSLVVAKHSRNKRASLLLGQLIWDQTNLKHADFDIIVPVPLHWTRYSWRWFNQAEEIAQIFSKKSGKPVVHLVTRIRRTASQTGLSRKDRVTNLSNAFSLSKDAQEYKNKKILFVDDVMTTGTTLKAVIKKTLVLKPEGLVVATACRVV